MRIRLIITDMASINGVNGVVRYIQELIQGLSHDKTYQIIWLRFLHQLEEDDIYVDEKQNIQIIRVSIPKNLQFFLVNQSCRLKLWEKTFQKICGGQYDKHHMILHVNTLNLMEFAIYVKNRTSCKIISHIHCIPWKALYNNHTKLFNKLYHQYYIQKEYKQISDYIMHGYEYLTYTQSDSIVCVTECARDFIKKICPNAIYNIHVVTNGIKDRGKEHNYIIEKRDFTKCLFVGNPTRSKGLEFLLLALQSIYMSHNIQIMIIGSYPEDFQRTIYNRFPFLNILFLGKLPFYKLHDIYTTADIGVIPSLQEQCSYVAIEMMMYGLPIIATDVDGLGELFTNKANALTISTQFRLNDGLKINILEMSNALLSLIEDEYLRQSIGSTARLCYQQKHTVEQMVKHQKEIYENIIK